MKRLKRICILFVYFLPVFYSGAFEWPLREHRVATTFGQNLAGGFNTGIDLLGLGLPVSPIADGEVIFAYDEGNSYTSLPRGAGSFMILYHQGNIHSVYSHLARGSLQVPDSGNLTRRDSLGTVGNTGSTLGGALFLQIIDVEENLVLNPLKQLKPAVPDNRDPVIRQVLLDRNNIGHSLVNRSVITPGPVSFLIDTADILPDLQRSYFHLAPRAVTLSENGVEVFRLVFDSLGVENGRFTISSTGQSYSELYTPGGFINLGELNLIQGITRFRFLVEDYAADNGNSASAEFQVTVAGE